MTFTAAVAEYAFEAAVYEQPTATSTAYIEESPCVIIPAVDLRAALNAPWHPRTMHAWMT